MLAVVDVVDIVADFEEEVVDIVADFEAEVVDTAVVGIVVVAAYIAVVEPDASAAVAGSACLEFHLDDPAAAADMVVDIRCHYNHHEAYWDAVATENQKETRN